MCGIVGQLNLRPGPPPAEAVLRRMLGMIRHRGPDQFGIYLGPQVALGSARLSIIDLSGGQQPIANEDGTLWIVFNGEVFNHVELRPDLEARGHRFTTHTDTEVILHLYEEEGPACLKRLNGQFAIAIWDRRRETLFLARDRLGVRPLFYCVDGPTLTFGSELKALLSARQAPTSIDPVALDQVFTFWSPLASRTIFRDIVEIPPGNYLTVRHGEITRTPYWQQEFHPEAAGRASSRGRTTTGADGLLAAEFRELLVDAVRIRLRADVPVGAYLSGGLDSSVIAAVIRNHTPNRLDTFSIAFNDASFDESQFQRRMAAHLGTQHQVLEATHAEIGRVFPDVIWHTEVPLMRTAPAPMFLLSARVRACGYKVVLTGEGADEFLAGYDIFKEDRIRRFWARQPASHWRPLLFRRLYPDIAALGQSNPAFLAAFFGEQLDHVDAPHYSHLIRWRNNRRACRFFSRDVIAEVGRSAKQSWDQLEFPAAFRSWSPLQRAQHLEIVIFLSQYLLSSQGDRMAMAHSVEGRFPFLDTRLVDFFSRLPGNLKLRGLTEKYLLKQAAREWLPAEIWSRPKRPYRAPIHRCFFGANTPDYVREMLSPAALRRSGLFNPDAVAQLVAKLDQGRPLGETDDMALAGILSTQLVHQQFVQDFRKATSLGARDDVKVCRQPQEDSPE